MLVLATGGAADLDCTEPLDCMDCTEWLEVSDTPPLAEEERRNLLKSEDELLLLLAITFPPGGRMASTCSGLRNSSYCLNNTTASKDAR